MFETQKETKPTYGIAATGPAVSSSEVETERAALEVVVQWGDESVLSVSHVAESGVFTLGESGEGLDFCVPASVLGLSRLELARLDEAGAVEFTLPAGAGASLMIDGNVQNLVPPPPPGASARSAGASRTHRLPEGATARIEIGDFTFLVRGVREGKKFVAGFAFDRRPLAYFAGVAAFTAVMLGVFSLVPPTSSALSVQNIETGHRLVEYMIESSESQPPPEPVVASDGGTEGAAAEGPSGQAGDETAPETGNRASVRGDAPPGTRQLARDPQDIVNDSSVIRVLAALGTSMPVGITSPFGADQTIGGDQISALGALMGREPGGSFGLGGLGPIGTGRGGGGDAQGTFGIDQFDTVSWTGSGGTEPGPGLRARRSTGPRVITPAPTATAGLSRNAIQRVVRRHVNEVRFCYEQGLQSRPDLEGRVVTRFMIAPNGSVQTAMTMPNSTLRNQRVESCVSRTVRRWTFPNTETGMPVTVTYPFSFRSN